MEAAIIANRIQRAEKAVADFVFSDMDSEKYAEFMALFDCQEAYTPSQDDELTPAQKRLIDPRYEVISVHSGSDHPFMVVVEFLPRSYGDCVEPKKEVMSIPLDQFVRVSNHLYDSEMTRLFEILGALLKNEKEALKDQYAIASAYLDSCIKACDYRFMYDKVKKLRAEYLQNRNLSISSQNRGKLSRALERNTRLKENQGVVQFGSEVNREVKRAINEAINNTGNTFPDEQTPSTISLSALQRLYPESDITLPRFKSPQELQQIWRRCGIYQAGQMVYECPLKMLYAKEFGEYFGFLPGFYAAKIRDKTTGELVDRDIPALTPFKVGFSKIMDFFTTEQKKSHPVSVLNPKLSRSVRKQLLQLLDYSQENIFMASKKTKTEYGYNITAPEGIFATLFNMICSHWVILDRSFAFQLMCLWSNATPSEMKRSLDSAGFKIKENMFVFDNDYKFYTLKQVGEVDCLYEQYYLTKDGSREMINDSEHFTNKAHIIEFLDYLVSEPSSYYQTFVVEFVHYDRGATSSQPAVIKHIGRNKDGDNMFNIRNYYHNDFFVCTEKNLETLRGWFPGCSIIAPVKRHNKCEEVLNDILMMDQSRIAAVAKRNALASQRFKKGGAGQQSEAARGTINIVSDEESEDSSEEENSSMSNQASDAASKRLKAGTLRAEVKRKKNSNIAASADNKPFSSTQTKTEIHKYYTTGKVYVLTECEKTYSDDVRMHAIVELCQRLRMINKASSSALTQVVKTLGYGAANDGQALLLDQIDQFKKNINPQQPISTELLEQLNKRGIFHTSQELNRQLNKFICSVHIDNKITGILNIINEVARLLNMSSQTAGITFAKVGFTGIFTIVATLHRQIKVMNRALQAMKGDTEYLGDGEPGLMESVYETSTQISEELINTRVKQMQVVQHFFYNILDYCYNHNIYTTVELDNAISTAFECYENLRFQINREGGEQIAMTEIGCEGISEKTKKKHSHQLERQVGKITNMFAVSKEHREQKDELDRQYRLSFPYSQMVDKDKVDKSFVYTLNCLYDQQSLLSVCQDLKTLLMQNIINPGYTHSSKLYQLMLGDQFVLRQNEKQDFIAYDSSLRIVKNKVGPNIETYRFNGFHDEALKQGLIEGYFFIMEQLLSIIKNKYPERLDVLQIKRIFGTYYNDIQAAARRNRLMADGQRQEAEIIRDSIHSIEEMKKGEQSSESRKNSLERSLDEVDIRGGKETVDKNRFSSTFGPLMHSAGLKTPIHFNLPEQEWNFFTSPPPKGSPSKSEYVGPTSPLIKSGYQVKSAVIKESHAARKERELKEQEQRINNERPTDEAISTMLKPVFKTFIHLNKMQDISDTHEIQFFVTKRSEVCGFWARGTTVGYFFFDEFVARFIRKQRFFMYMKEQMWNTLENETLKQRVRRMVKSFNQHLANTPQELVEHASSFITSKDFSARFKLLPFTRMSNQTVLPLGEGVIPKAREPEKPKESRPAAAQPGANPAPTAIRLNLATQPFKAEKRYNVCYTENNEICLYWTEDNWVFYQFLNQCLLFGCKVQDFIKFHRRCIAETATMRDETRERISNILKLYSDANLARHERMAAADNICGGERSKARRELEMVSLLSQKQIGLVLLPYLIEGADGTKVTTPPAEVDQFAVLYNSNEDQANKVPIAWQTHAEHFTFQVYYQPSSHNASSKKAQSVKSSSSVTDSSKQRVFSQTLSDSSDSESSHSSRKLSAAKQTTTTQAQVKKPGLSFDNMLPNTIKGSSDLENLVNPRKPRQKLYHHGVKPPGISPHQSSKSTPSQIGSTMKTTIDLCGEENQVAPLGNQGGEIKPAGDGNANPGDSANIKQSTNETTAIEQSGDGSQQNHANEQQIAENPPEVVTNNEKDSLNNQEE